ncbi:hypothetical protein INR49_016264 [Caranx melampygus]|nr:hypothetical protein INR49_016264 [Caranx melampygus]
MDRTTDCRRTTPCRTFSLRPRSSGCDRGACEVADRSGRIHPQLCAQERSSQGRSFSMITTMNDIIFHRTAR